jgi:hypothetical protein
MSEKHLSLHFLLSEKRNPVPVTSLEIWILGSHTLLLLTCGIEDILLGRGSKGDQRRLHRRGILKDKYYLISQVQRLIGTNKTGQF